MLGELKNLGKETVIYGFSTVLARLLNFLLLPLYTHALVPAEYGVVATVFSYIAFLNVLYGYGMDFAFMRYFDVTPAKAGAQKLDSGLRRNDGSSTFSTAFWSLGATSLVFSGLLFVQAPFFSRWSGIPENLASVTRYAALILALDALALVPFAALRMRHKAWAFASIKSVNIAVNLILNFVLLIHFHMGVRGVFLASLGASATTLALLVPFFLTELRWRFDLSHYRALLRFALPLVPAGLASMMVQVIDRPILKFMTNDATVGIYQANYRLGIFMMMVVNMFDAAWRPYFIQRAEHPGAPESFARVLTYFVVGAGFLLVAVSFFIAPLVSWPLLAGKPLIGAAYWSGLSIVPVVTAGYLFNGIYINFLAAPTLAKKSELVAYATGLGALVNIGTNLWWIPHWGMTGAAWATFAAYAAMALALWLMGRRLYPIPYEGGRILDAGTYLLLVWVIARALHLGVGTDRLALRAGLTLFYPLALALTGFFKDDERQAFRRAVSRLRV